MTEPSEVPALFGPERPLRSSRPVLESVFANVLASQNAIPGFAIEDQKQSMWCWAAVTLAVERSYSPGTPLTQCSIASLFPLGVPPARHDCCGSNASQCNEPISLKKVLTQLGRLASEETGDEASAEVIRTDIDGRRPLCARIRLPGSDVGHFVVITGYKYVSGRQYLQVHDPADNGAASNVRTDLPYEEFAFAYWGTATEWTHHYRTHGS